MIENVTFSQNSMTTEFLAPCVTRSSAAIVLTKYDEHLLVVYSNYDDSMVPHPFFQSYYLYNGNAFPGKSLYIETGTWPR